MISLCVIRELIHDDMAFGLEQYISDLMPILMVLQRECGRTMRDTQSKAAIQDGGFSSTSFGSC